MRKKKTPKKIRRIYKARLWPAIVFFVITAILSVLGACIFAISSMGDIVESAIETASVNTVYMANTITAAGADDEYVLNNLREFGLEVPDSFLIADSSGQVVAQTGDAPEDPVSLYMVNFQDSPYAIYEVYAERKDDHEYWVSDIFPRDQGLKALSFFNVSQAFLDNPAIGKQDYRHVAFDAILWVRVPLSTEGYLQARWEINIYAVDLYQKFFDSIRFYGIFFLPILILLIYLIASIRNHRHATKILYTEPVTGGRNFLYYEYYGGKKLRKNTKNGPTYAVVDVSVNKLVNYCLAYGISSGERLHTAVYKALTSLLSKGEICAFDGRTCFALLIKSTDRNSTIIRVSEMLDKIVRIIPHGGISLRAGIFFPDVSEEQGSPLTARVTDPLICYNNAHAALVSLPDENANSVKVYDLSIAEKRLWIRHVEDGLQRALRKEEFLVYIQPKYNPKTNELAGAEALIRWENATDGFIAPYRFIPILEQNRTITKVDDYMLDHVARYQAEWLAEGKEVVPVSVNLSRTHFSDADLADHIASIVDKYNLPHKYIEIELTESAFFDNAEQLLQLVKDIKAKGFEISMDDFGSGYSSLNSLINLPLDVLKLDAGFFRDLQDEEKARTVVLAAIRLAKKLNMRIVAEGVEEKAQVDYLAEQGCDMIQGYYYEKPMPAAEYAELMGKPARVSLKDE